MTCSRCHGPNDRPGQRYCRACHAAYMRANRPMHRDLPPEQRKRANTRAYSRVLEQRGQLKRKPCRKCGANHAERHHPDYSNPRLVDWLCTPCHQMEHALS